MSVLSGTLTRLSSGRDSCGTPAARTENGASETTLAAGREENEGENLVVHEFAHQLDMQNGRTADGMPPMAT